MRQLSSDPWSWPELTADELRQLASVSGLRPDGPLFQYVAVRECMTLRAAIEGGDGFAVMEAVHLCAWRGLVMPDWLAGQFLRRYRAVAHYEAATWDDPKSFGRPHPKGTNIAAQRKRRLLMFAVHSAVTDILQREPETPIDVALFERVGSPLCLGKTLTAEYFYEAEAFLFRHRGSSNERRKCKATSAKNDNSAE